MLREIVRHDTDPFGLRILDFNVRVPERSELFDEDEARTYIEGCDYPESVDDLLLALEMQNLFGAEAARTMKILDAMCGPGKLGRELLGLGAQQVVFHDGHETMIAHAKAQAWKVVRPDQNIGFVRSVAESTGLPTNLFDLVVCHNSTHQLSDLEKLTEVTEEFLRITAPGGHIIIADYQRATTPEFLTALEERLQCTRPEIVPLLLPTFLAAFSKEEFGAVLGSIPGIEQSWVFDAESPNLSEEMQRKIEADPVKGHLMDYSPISQRVIIRKAQTQI